MYSLRMSVWIVPAEALRRDALLLCRDDVEGEHDRRRRVDRHRRRDLADVDALEERLHVIERVDGDALAAHLALGARMVGVVAHQRRHVERRREARLAVVEQVAEALVRLLRRAEARELAERPQPAAVHRRVHTARVRVLAREAQGRSSRPPRCRAGRPARPLIVEKSASRSGDCKYFSRYQRSASVRRVSSATGGVYGALHWTNVRCAAACRPARLRKFKDEPRTSHLFHGPHGHLHARAGWSRAGVR